MQLIIPPLRSFVYQEQNKTTTEGIVEEELSVPIHKLCVYHLVLISIGAIIDHSSLWSSAADPYPWPQDGNNNCQVKLTNNNKPRPASLQESISNTRTMLRFIRSGWVIY